MASALIPFLKVGNDTLQDRLSAGDASISSEMRYGGDCTAIRFTDTGSPAGSILMTIRALANPDLEPATLSNWVANAVLRNQQRQNDPSWLAESAFRRHLYANDNRQCVWAESSALNTITAADLRACYCGRAAAPAPIVTAPSRYRIAAALAELPRAQSHPPANRIAAPSWRHSASFPSPQVLLVDLPGSNRASLCIGNLAFDRYSPDYATGAVLGRILGYGQSSRLHILLRSKGYAYTVFAGFSAERYLQHFAVKSDVDPRTAIPAVSAILDEFRRLGESVAKDEEITTAQAGIVTAFVQANDSASESLPLLAEIPRYGLPPTYWTSYLHSVIHVTPQDIRAVSVRYLPCCNAQIVVVGDVKAIGGSWDRFGHVRVIPASAAFS
ncbi:MAG: insulinase family protein [Acidobacteriaceae bacterium]|nr:insulinase family protein [Acidobacteriaceae bacterium]